MFPKPVSTTHLAFLCPGQPRLQLNNPEKQPSPPRYQKEGAQLFPDMTPAKMGPKKERLFLLIRNIPVPPPPKLDFKFSQALKPLLL